MAVAAVAEAAEGDWLTTEWFEEALTVKCLVALAFTWLMLVAVALLRLAAEVALAEEEEEEMTVFGPHFMFR